MIEVTVEFLRETVKVVRILEKETLQTIPILQNLMAIITEKGIYLLGGSCVSMRNRTRKKRNAPWGNSPAAIPLSSRPNKGKATVTGKELSSFGCVAKDINFLITLSDLE